MVAIIDFVKYSISIYLFKIKNRKNEIEIINEEKEERDVNSRKLLEKAFKKGMVE